MANVIYNETFEDFFKTRARFAVLFGGSGSGKSVAAAQKMLMRAVNEPNTRHLITRKLKSTIKESVFKNMKQIILDSDLMPYVKTNSTDMSFTFFNGSEIITSGLDDHEKIKSLTEVVSIWAEEATEYDKMDITQLNLRLRGNKGLYKQIILTFNPISELHWLKKEFFDKKSPSVFTMQSTFMDNKFIDEAYKEELIKRYSDDPNVKRVYILGEWGRVVTGAEFYSGFNFQKHCKDSLSFHTEDTIHLSYDFNARPFSPALVSQVVKGIDGRWKVYVLDEITMRNPLNTTEACTDEFLNRYKDLIQPPLFIYGDASGRARNPLNNLNNYEIIEAILAPYLNANSIRVPKANPQLLKRRQWINRVLRGEYPIDIYIDKKCVNLIEDFENVLEDKDGKPLKVIKRDKETGTSYEKHGHLSDSFCYFIIECFKGYYETYEAITDR